MNLESEWYNQTANAAYSIGGRRISQYPISPTVQQHFRIVSNKDLIKDIGKEQPYQDVFDGTWTFDKMLGVPAFTRTLTAISRRDWETDTVLC